MAYKKYIKRNGKLYGPYLYESYRDENGKVINRYVSKPDAEQEAKPAQMEDKQGKVPEVENVTVPSKESVPAIEEIPVPTPSKDIVPIKEKEDNVSGISRRWSLLLPVFVFVILLLISSTIHLTGNVGLEMRDNYAQGENLEGKIILALGENEFIPANSTILVSVGSASWEFVLSEIVDAEKGTGDYYAGGEELGGSGEGYGNTTLEIDIAKLNLAAEQGTFSVSLVYGNAEIAYSDIEIIVISQTKAVAEFGVAAVPSGTSYYVVRDAMCWGKDLVPTNCTRQVNVSDNLRFAVKADNANSAYVNGSWRINLSEFSAIKNITGRVEWQSSVKGIIGEWYFYNQTAGSYQLARCPNITNTLKGVDANFSCNLNPVYGGIQGLDNVALKIKFYRSGGQANIKIDYLGLIVISEYRTGNQTLSIDRELYAPEEIVRIGGQSWGSGASVVLDVRYNSSSLSGYPVTLTANASGAFTYNFSVPFDANLGDYGLLAYRVSNHSLNATAEFEVDMVRYYENNTLIIPMDWKQDTDPDNVSFLRAYGMIDRLIDNGYPVDFVVSPKCAHFKATDIDSGDVYDEDYCHGSIIIPDPNLTTTLNEAFVYLNGTLRTYYDSARGIYPFRSVVVHRGSGYVREGDRISLKSTLKLAVFDPDNKGNFAATLDESYLNYTRLTSAQVLANALVSQGFDFLDLDEHDFGGEPALAAAIKAFTDSGGSLSAECKSTVTLDPYTQYFPNITDGPALLGLLRVYTVDDPITQSHVLEDLPNEGGSHPTLDMTNVKVNYTVYLVDDNFDTNPNIVKMVGRQLTNNSYVLYAGGHIGIRKGDDLETARNRIAVNNFFIAVAEAQVPPATITNLNETAKGATWIYWNWTNPADSNFNHVEVWINGTFYANVPKQFHSVNVTGLAPGTTYVISTRTVGKKGLMNTTWVNDSAMTSFIPAAPMELVINSPISATYNNRTILVNVTATGTSSVWFFNGSANVTYTSPVYVTFPEGSNIFTVYANDSAGNVNSTFVTFSVDVTAPLAVVLAPQNNTITNESLQNFTVNLSDAQGLRNATVNIYNETGLYNRTTTALGGVGGAVVGVAVNLVAGTYSWFWQVFDLASNLFTSDSSTISVDTTAPYLAFVSPLNTGYYTNSTVLVNITSSGASSIWFWNGTANVAYTAPVYINLGDGSTTITAYANDSAGNVNSTSVTFTINTTVADTSPPVFDTANTSPQPGSQYNQTNPVLIAANPSENSTVSANISWDATSQIVNLIYNGTEWFYSLPFVNTSYPGTYVIVINATDVFGNSNITVTNFTINDVTAPLVSELAPANGTKFNPGQPINVSVNATDLNYDSVSSVIAQLTYPNGSSVNYTMAEIDDSQIFDVVINSSALGIHNITVIAADSFGNSNTSSSWINLTWGDVTAPSILNTGIEPYDPAIGENVLLNMSASDNIAVSGTFANLTLPNGSIITMSVPGSYTIPIAGRYNVTFFANDSTGNTASFEDYFIAGTMSFNITFNAVNYLLAGIPVNLTIYFANTNKEVNKHEFVGTFVGRHTDILYDLLFVTDFGARVRLNGVNLSIYTNGTIGIDRNSLISGNLVTYGINTTYGFVNSNVLLSYSGTGYTNEGAIIIEKCNAWDFVARACLGTWSNITQTAERNTTGDNFAFNVTSFSGFGIREPAIAPVPSGGGGGGGGGGAAVVPVLNLSANLIEVSLVQGEQTTVPLGITNFGSVFVDVTAEIEGLGGIASISENYFVISAYGRHELGVIFDVSEDLEPGVYTGKILVTTKYGQKTANIILTVKKGGALFDMIVNVDKESESVFAGGSVGYEISLQNLGAQRIVGGRLVVSVTDLDKKAVLVVYNGDFLMERNQSLGKILGEFGVPSGLAPGKYMLLGRLSYDNSSAEAYDLFEVKSKGEATAIGEGIKGRGWLLNLIFLLILLIELILLIIVLLRGRHPHRQLHETRMAKEKLLEEKKILKRNMRKLAGRKREEAKKRLHELEGELKRAGKEFGRYVAREREILGAENASLAAKLEKLHDEFRKRKVDKKAYERAKKKFLGEVSEMERHFRRHVLGK